MLQMQRVSEALNEMKQQFEEEKRLICNARNDINAITTLLSKTKQLPIISEISGKEYDIQDVQRAKLMKQIHNYNIVVEDLTIEVNIHDQQLEEKRRRDIENESTINLYNTLHEEAESLMTKRDSFKSILKLNQGEMAKLTNEIQLSTLDIDIIEKSLDTRTQLFEDYMEGNKISDGKIQKITTELGHHIQDIKTLSNEFISGTGNPERIQELLKKIQEKEDILDQASVLFKKYAAENVNLQQLFNAIRLNNMTKIFELLIKNYQKMVFDLTCFKQKIDKLRSELAELENTIGNKELELEAILGDLLSNMKIKPVFTNSNNKELLEYFMTIYNQKKDNQLLKNLDLKIKQKGNEVMELCRNIISYQEEANQKISLEIGAKTSLIKKLQDKFSTLQKQVQESERIRSLQSQLANLMKENEQLSLINACVQTNGIKQETEIKIVNEHLNFLQIRNAELAESNLHLTYSNADLKDKLAKMENYVVQVRRCVHLHTDDGIYSSEESEDSM